ncbi:MAG: hypothetical protein CMJ64_19265 [Planctomycetaceae bacterium]|nr:hypothetical protein [Planctomycetaceae bacterium]
MLTIALCLSVCPTAVAGEPQRLTDDGRFKLTPFFFPGDDAVVYCVHDIPNRITLMKLQLAEHSLERMLPLEERHQWDADVSPDGRYLVYSRANNGPQIQLVIYDHKAKKEFLYNPQEFRSGIRCPKISPDMKHVIFGQSAPGGQQIASVNMQGSDLKLLTEASGINTHPDYSPDGKQIVFSSSRAENFDIFVMNADGSQVRKLTDSPGLDMHPVWSPDGKRIAFTSGRDGNYEIYLIDADGSNPTNLTQHPERDDFPNWRPDGSKLVTVSERKGRFDLYLFDIPSHHAGKEGGKSNDLNQGNKSRGEE